MSLHRSLQARSPFVGAPVARARPVLPVQPDTAFNPAAPVGGSNVPQAYSLSSISFGARYSAGITSAFPVGTLLGNPQGFTSPVGLVSISLSSSIYNTSTNAVMGLIVCKYNGPTINVTSTPDIMVSHWCEIGLAHSMRSGVTFSDETAPRYSSSEKIAVYVVTSGDGIVANRATALVTIRYFTV